MDSGKGKGIFFYAPTFETPRLQWLAQIHDHKGNPGLTKKITKDMILGQMICTKDGRVKRLGSSEMVCGYNSNKILEKVN